MEYRKETERKKVLFSTKRTLIAYTSAAFWGRELSVWKTPKQSNNSRVFSLAILLFDWFSYLAKISCCSLPTCTVFWKQNSLKPTQRNIGTSVCSWSFLILKGYFSSNSHSGELSLFTAWKVCVLCDCDVHCKNRFAKTLELNWEYKWKEGKALSQQITGESFTFYSKLINLFVFSEINRTKKILHG